jgi:hypothetical protein
LKSFALIDVSDSHPLLVINVGKLINKAGMFPVISFINLGKIFRNLWGRKCSLTHNASICFSFVKSNEIMWGNVNVIQITNRQFFHCHMFVCEWHLTETVAYFFFYFTCQQRKVRDMRLTCSRSHHDVSVIIRISGWKYMDFWKDFDETCNWLV